MRRGSLPHWLLVTSERLVGLQALLGSAGVPDGVISTLSDPMDLFRQRPSPLGTVLLDADATPSSDLGIVTRWARLHPGHQVLWVTSDPALAEQKLADSGAPSHGMIPWPLRDEDLEALVQGRDRHPSDDMTVRNPQAAANSKFVAFSASNGGAADPHLGSSTGGPEEELSAIEAILAEAPAPLPGSIGGSIAGPTSTNGHNGNGSEPQDSHPQDSRNTGAWAPGPGRSQTNGSGSHIGDQNGSARSPQGPNQRPSDTVRSSGVSRARGILPLTDPHDAPPRTAFLLSPIAPRVPSAPRILNAPGTSPSGADSQATPPLVDLPVEPPTERNEPLYDPREPLLSAEEIDAFFDPPLASPSGSALPDEAAGFTAYGDAMAATGLEPLGHSDLAPPPQELSTPEPPVWMKDQIADLADLVQALDLRARSNHAHVGMESELARLRQFTRTLGLVASPPAHGDQVFDLGTYVEEQLGALAGQTPNAPRLLFRKRGDLFYIQADKPLIAAAMDALLQTSIQCAGAGDVIRVSVTEKDDELAVRIEFPEGPLSGMAPQEILRPYALKKTLPGIGPNALSAAGAIAVGQGGDLVLEEVSGSKLAFELRFSALHSDPSSS